MPSIAQPDDIARFVRDTLGCTCPPEVFEHIELESIADDTNPHPLQRIVLGERLLVYLAFRTGPGGLPSRVAALTVRGRRDRDDHCYNRFRLVIAGGYEGAIREQAASRFKEIAEGDKKLHLHFVAVDDMPPLLCGSK